MGTQSVIRDAEGVGRAAERVFAPYRHTVLRQWEIERAAHCDDVTLDLVCRINSRTHHVEFAYRTQFAFRPSKSAGTVFNMVNRDVIWVWMSMHDTREPLCFGFVWPSIRN